MNTHHLKATNAEELKASLDAERLSITDADTATVNYYGSAEPYHLDWIGEIFKPTGNTLTDEEGNEYPEMASVGGHHMNVYSDVDLPDSLSIYVIAAPTTPYRRIAGS